MQEALYEGKHIDLKLHLESAPILKDEIERMKKRADKGAYLCPYCSETLILKSGEIREVHFAHRHSKSCEVSVASEVYHNQIKRESKKHSVMKEIIFDELKAQEKIRPELQVEYGYVTKAAEKWRYYPDIVLNNKGKELAITVLTDVNSNKDEKMVNQIKKRNRYFKSKNMEPIWFVEDAEQSIDKAHRVIHLWEAELDIAVKTNEDILWEQAINKLDLKENLFKLFNYFHNQQPTSFSVQSLYYVQSTETNIVFTVQRFIRDEERYPFRAFALNDAYQINLSSALRTTETLQLSDPSIEEAQRVSFINEAKEREEAEEEKRQREHQERLQFEKENEERRKQAATLSRRVGDGNNRKPLLTNTRKRDFENRNLPFSDAEMESHINKYLTTRDRLSATEVSEYLVHECGASAETYSTGRYKIYSNVCQVLDQFERTGILKLVKKESTTNRFYHVQSPISQ